MNKYDKSDVLHDLTRGICYVSPYVLATAEQLLELRSHSVEHVLPRIRVNSSEAGMAENDPNGFVLADRRANSRRGALPLVLWRTCDDTVHSDNPTKSRIVSLDGERHFLPPLSHRARLARKWLFLRATYSDVDRIDPPSTAQTKHKNDIIHLCETTPALTYEKTMNRMYRERFDWHNPLIEQGASRWYESAAWVSLCFD